MYVKFNNIKIKYVIYFILGFILAITVSNAKAMTILESGSLKIDEEYIYNEMFNATGYSIDNYSNIICEYSYYVNSNSYGGITCRAFNNIDNLVTSNFSSMNERFTYSYEKPYLYYKIVFNKSTGSITEKTLTTSDSIGGTSSIASYGGNGSTSNSSNKVYSNFDFIKGSSLSTINSKINKLDFGMYMIKPAITIDYLNDKYEVLKTSDCYLNKIDPKCELDINDNNGSYIKITYRLKELIGENLDFLNNNTYQLRTKATGFTNDTKLAHYIYSYYFNDSTSNVNNALVYPNNVTHYVNDNLHTYLSTFINKTDYENILVYEFSEFYETNGSSYTTVSIPFTFVVGNLGANLDRVEEIQINNQSTIIDQNQTKIDQNNKLNESLDDLNNAINNSDINGASGAAGGFFENFKDNDYGLSDIITIPLNTIKTITNGKCTAINAKLPYLDKQISLPCLGEVYHSKFPEFLLFYNIIMYGFISYWVIVQIYALVKGFKDPDNDKIEVVDL